MPVRKSRCSRHPLLILNAVPRREIAEHRLNRFLHVHLSLCAIAGLLPLFTPDAAERSAAAWVLQSVLYCLSLSALLLGLSAAHGDAEEFPLLFTQPVDRSTWLAGKAAAIAALLWPASILLIAPAALTGGVTASLLFVGAAAAGVSISLAMLGLAIGFWVRDQVRGLLLALGVWFALLFGMDLLLLALAGWPWIHRHATIGYALDAQPALDIASDDDVHARSDGAGWHWKRRAGRMVAEPRRVVAGDDVVGMDRGGVRPRGRRRSPTLRCVNR